MKVHEQECELRREGNRQSQSRKRANESEADCEFRRGRERKCKATKKASETEHETAARRTSNRLCKATKKAIVRLSMRLLHAELATS